MNRVVPIACMVLFGIASLGAQTGKSRMFPAGSPKVFVSVLSGSVNNSVGQARMVGVFVRAEEESVWTIVPNANTLAFASGYSRHGDSVRYYACGGNGLFRSEDRGATWRMLTDWGTMEILNVAIDPRDETNIYAATPFGVYRSKDDGATWRESIRGMKKWYVQNVLFSRTSPDVLYAVSEDDAYRSDDRGDHWTPLETGAVSEVRAILEHPSDRFTLAVGTEDNGIRMSADGGRTWRAAAGTNGQTIIAFAASADGTSLYAGGFRTGVMKSTDRGLTWKKVSDATLTCEAIYAILVHPSDPSHLYLGGNGTGLWESRDGGRSWKQTALPGTHIMHIGMYP